MDEVRNDIRRRGIACSPHVPEIEQRQGRPDRSVAIGFLENRLDDLKQAWESRKRRIVLVFHASGKYDLRVVARLAATNLYVISYNWLKKKHKPLFKTRIPEAKTK